MSNKRIVIKDLEPQYNAEYIAKYFWNKQIAKASSITILPYILNGKIKGIAYITFDEFCDSVSSKEFLYNMVGSDAYIICHSDYNENDLWVLEPNHHFDGDFCVSNHTVNFMPEFFEIYENSNYYLCSEDKFQDLYPIKGLYNNRYSLDEAISYLWLLNLQWEQETNTTKKKQIASEIYHIDSSTRFYIMTTNETDNPLTINYNKELTYIFDELAELEIKNYFTWRESLTPPQRETNDWHLQPETQFSSLLLSKDRREIAMSINK